MSPRLSLYQQVGSANLPDDSAGAETGAIRFDCRSGGNLGWVTLGSAVLSNKTAGPPTLDPGGSLATATTRARNGTAGPTVIKGRWAPFWFHQVHS